MKNRSPNIIKGKTTKNINWVKHGWLCEKNLILVYLRILITDLFLLLDQTVSMKPSMTMAPTARKTTTMVTEKKTNFWKQRTVKTSQPAGTNLKNLRNNNPHEPHNTHKQQTNKHNTLKPHRDKHHLLKNRRTKRQNHFQQRRLLKKQPQILKNQLKVEARSHRRLQSWTSHLIWAQKRRKMSVMIMLTMIQVCLARRITI